MGKFRPYIVEVLAALLILLFVYAALSKLMNLHAFQNTLSHSLFLNKYRRIIVIIIPITELITSGLLFIPEQREKGFILSAFLMFAFTIYIAFMLLFAVQLPCSCGGVLGSMGWKSHLVFNCLFTLLACFGWHIESLNKIDQLKILLQ